MKKFFGMLLMLTTSLEVSASIICAKKTVLEYVNQADTVFVGVPTKVTLIGNPFRISADVPTLIQRAVTDFRVSAVWKGGHTNNPMVTIYNGFGWMSQIPPFQTGKEYLIFARGYPATDWLQKSDRKSSFPKPTDVILEVDVCWGTISLDSPEGKQEMDNLKELFKDTVKILPPK